MRAASTPLAILLSALTGATLAAEAAAQSAGWPQWRGPGRDNISTERDWLSDGEGALLWEARPGIGYSNVAIADGRLFTLGHDKDAGRDTVFCLDAASGEEVWSFSFPADTMAKAHGGGVLSTPTIDGEFVYVANREGNFFKFRAADGEILWRKNLVEEHGAKIPRWGLAASPLLLDDTIVMNVGPVLAFDAEGALRWQSDDGGDCYSTPAPFEHGGEPLLAVFNGNGLSVMSQADGSVLATTRWQTQYDVNAATPVVVGDRIFISSGYGRGCAMYAFDGESLEQLWENREMRNHMSGCVAYQDHLYGFDDGAYLKCLSLDGKVMWQERGFGKGALTIAGDHLLILTRRGALVTARATPAGFSESSSQKVLEEGGQQWTTPVLYEGLVYCRSSIGQLVCIDRRRP